MSTIFREFVRKIGSGTHTGQDLTREEAAIATRMILLQEATPAQIGAFLIAHRIKRPTGEELAGMLDAYDQLGPKLQSIDAAYPVSVMGSPYDGRSRTAPISPLTALVLATAACPVIQHGGRRMPTKEGDPLVDFWLGLGVDWTQLSLLQVQQVLEQTGVGFVYLPQHFPAAEHLVTYREEIGKRPPVATIELIWSPYQGTANQVAGFVHPPTETMIRQAYELRGTSFFTLVKGLEGSCDLPRERTAIISVSGAVSAHDPASHPIDPTEIQRLCRYASCAADASNLAGRANRDPSIVVMECWILSLAMRCKPRFRDGCSFDRSAASTRQGSPDVTEASTSDPGRTQPLIATRSPKI
jgi:anthranilate phosphoribosyltransferase